jgi:hypothetical protein
LHGTWNLDQDVVVTDDSTISAPALVSLEADGITTFTVSATKTLTVSGYFYDSNTLYRSCSRKSWCWYYDITSCWYSLPAAFTVSWYTLAVTANNALGTTAQEQLLQVEQF